MFKEIAMVSMNEFRFSCRKCGSHDLGYQKYVKCISPVFLQGDGFVKYSDSEFDEDDSLCTQNGFMCMNCKSLIEHCGCRLETEPEILSYLAMDPAVRDQQQREYDEMEAQMAEEQDSREIPIDKYDEEYSHEPSANTEEIFVDM